MIGFFLLKGAPANVFNSLHQPDIHAALTISRQYVASGPLRLHHDGSEAMFDVTTAIRGTSDAAREDAHPDITLDHGLNLLCLNCHHRSNNDVTSITTAKIPAEEPTRLCAKCHGPTF